MAHLCIQCHQQIPRTDAAQSDAGQTAMWYISKAGGGNLYVTSLNSDTQPLLSFLFQAAYNNGDFTLDQIKSVSTLPLFVDQDHVTGSSFNTDLTALNRFLSRIPAGGMVWCGITGGETTGTHNVDVMSDDVKDALQGAHSAGKIKFCYHNHYVPWKPLTGVYPNTVDVLDKAQQLANYSALKLVAESKGLFFDELGGHYNPGENMWNENTLQLLEDKGIVSARYATSNQCSRPAPSMSTHPKSVLKNVDFIRGITLMPCSDYASKDVITNDSDWRAIMQKLCQAIHYGMIIYVHDEDFIDTQNPKTGEYGVELFDQLNDLNNYMTHTVKAFADVTDYV